MEGIPSCVTVTVWSATPGALTVMVAERARVLAVTSQVTVKLAPLAPVGEAT